MEHLWHELEHLLLSPGHWAFEVVTDVVFAIPAYFAGRWGLRRHDRKVHGRHTDTKEN